MMITKDSIKVLHVIVSLKRGGGAEEMLYRLVKDNNKNCHVIVALTSAEGYSDELLADGFEVHSLGINKTPLSILRLISLVNIIKKCEPDIVQTWMYYSDVLGGICARIAGVRNIVWGIHHSTMDDDGSSWTSKVFRRFSALLSRFIPKQIISCSSVGASTHINCGYRKEKMRVVHNGYDLTHFAGLGDFDRIDHRVAILSKYLNRELNTHSVDIGSKEVFVMGMVARFDPQKDHENLLSSLQILLERKKEENWICFLFGSGVSKENDRLNDLIVEKNLLGRVFLCGKTSEIAQVVKAFDLSLLSSRFGEAFPNVLNESMASEVPVVSTNVGDSSKIVAQYGWVVETKNPIAFSDAIVMAKNEMTETPDLWAERKRSCRKHIENNFSIARMSEEYEKVWRM